MLAKNAVRKIFEKISRVALYHFLSFPICIALFIYSCFALPLSFGLVFLACLGLVVLAGYLYSMKFIIRGEILRINYFMKTPFSLPEFRENESDTFGKRFFGILRNNKLWSGVLYTFTLFPIGIAAFVSLTIVVLAPFKYLQLLFGLLFDVNIFGTNFVWLENAFGLGNNLKIYGVELDIGIAGLAVLPLFFIFHVFILYILTKLQNILVRYLLCDDDKAD